MGEEQPADSVLTLDLDWKKLASSETVIVVEMTAVMRMAPWALPSATAKMVLEWSRVRQVMSRETAGCRLLLAESRAVRAKALQCRARIPEA
jgi:hypothetical protein